MRPAHGTAFKTDWMNNGLYEIAFLHDHARVHSVALESRPAPQRTRSSLAATRRSLPAPAGRESRHHVFLQSKGYPKYFRHVLLHSTGRMSAEEKTYIPEMEFPKVYRRARVYLAIYAVVIGLSIYYRSVLPLLLVGLTNLFGSWLVVTYGTTQHAGLAENVLDHRLNCRTVYMNPIHRYLYWNMNYHVEHHMYPLVPYHAPAEVTCRGEGRLRHTVSEPIQRVA